MPPRKGRPVVITLLRDKEAPPNDASPLPPGDDLQESIVITQPHGKPGLIKPLLQEQQEER